MNKRVSARDTVELITVLNYTKEICRYRQ